jgi:hypothetical protein
MKGDKFDDYSASTIIKSLDEKYELGILLNEDGSKDYNFVWLALNLNNDKLTIWDNPNYLFNQLYDTLYHFNESKEIIDKEDFKDICEDILIEDFKQVFQLLEFGIKLGFKS